MFGGLSLLMKVKNMIIGELMQNVMKKLVYPIIHCGEIGI